METLIQQVIDVRLRLHFANGYEDHKTGEVRPNGIWGGFDCGTIVAPGKDEDLYLVMSHQLLIHMMEGNLNSSEMLMAQFNAANTFVHEFMVR